MQERSGRALVGLVRARPKYCAGLAQRLDNHNNVSVILLLCKSDVGFFWWGGRGQL